jgi:molybdopterin-guanine dinucleotide biosynthesis protein A
MPVIADATAALLAGGRARRLGGVDKGAIALGDTTIARRSLDLFGTLFERTLVVGGDAQPGVETIPDLIPGKGAPGGLHAALGAATTGWVFAAACDMPFLDAEGIARLAACRSETVDLVLVQWEGRLQPLHAFWSRRCLPILEWLLSRGQPSLQDLADGVRAEIVTDAEWRRIDPAGRAFTNVNTPADLERIGAIRPPCRTPATTPRAPSR